MTSKLLMQIFVLSSLFLLAQAAISATDIDILNELYDATDGANWRDSDNWLVGDPCGDEEGNGVWKGIQCNEDSSAIESISLDNNDLTGTLPASLSQLTSLNALFLSSNQLSGTIPSEYGSLSSLSFLNLDNNDLTGTIPTTLKNLVELRRLALDSNRLTGFIPDDLFASMASLTEVTLNNNRLAGSLPSSLSDQMTLQYLDLSNNRLEGTISTQLATLSLLKSFKLNSNNLYGILSEDFAHLDDLLVFDVSGNSLSGVLSDHFGASGAQLDLSSNYWACPLPAFCESPANPLTMCGECYELDYCQVHDHPGANDNDVEECVCAFLVTCCSEEWTQACVDAVDSEGCGTCVVPSPSPIPTPSATPLATPEASPVVEPSPSPIPGNSTNESSNTSGYNPFPDTGVSLAAIFGIIALISFGLILVVIIAVIAYRWQRGLYIPFLPTRRPQMV